MLISYLWVELFKIYAYIFPAPLCFPFSDLGIRNTFDELLKYIIYIGIRDQKELMIDNYHEVAT